MLFAGCSLMVASCCVCLVLCVDSCLVLGVFGVLCLLLGRCLFVSSLCLSFGI